MNKEQIAIYTRRIAASNRSELIVVLYDILDTYLQEAETAIVEQDWALAKESLRRASQVVEHLKSDLDFKYEIATQLYPLYDFAQRAIAKSIYTRRAQGIEEAQRVLRPLATVFAQVAQEDSSDPIMQNTQQIVAGYTYGKTNLTESTQDFDTSRGFLA